MAKKLVAKVPMKGKVVAESKGMMKKEGEMPFNKVKEKANAMMLKKGC